MSEAVKQERRQILWDLQAYLSAYETEDGLGKYPEKAFLCDMVYGIAIAVNNSHLSGSDYERFKRRLIEYLKEV